MEEDVIRNSNLRAEIAELRDKIADLEGELAVAKAQQWANQAITWYPIAGTSSTVLPVTYNGWTSGSNWIGT